MRLIQGTPQVSAFLNSIDMKESVLKIKDGTTTPNELTVLIGEGNLSWTERQERQYELDRGNLDTVRNGDDTFRREVVPALGSV